MKKLNRWVSALAGALLVVSRTAGARPSEKFELPDWSKTPVEDRDLGHGVHMLESFGGNIGVLAGDQGVLLIDAEWPQLHDKVLAAVSHISTQPVRYLVNTHWHWDHVGGDGLFGKAGCGDLLQRADARVHRKGAGLESLPRPAHPTRLTRPPFRW